MVKLQAPCLSLQASGSIAGSLVFSSWKGRAYCRSLVKPSNPKSGGQVGIRSMFRWLSQQWAALSDVDKATWEDRADQKVVSPFNAYVSLGQYRWADFLAPSTMDPPAVAMTPPTDGAGAATAGVRSITVEQAITTASDGWGVLFFRALAPAFTTAFDNLIGVGLIVGTADVVWVDSPLDPDTYYYNMRSFTEDGQLGPEIGEVNAIVT